MHLVSLGIGGAILVTLASAAVLWSREHEPFAARQALWLSLLLPLPYLAAGLLPVRGRGLLATALTALTAAVVAWLVFPDRWLPQRWGRSGAPDGQPDDADEENGDRGAGLPRVDERDIMFSRWLLEPGSERYQRYYRNRPEREAADSRFRAKPGPLSRRASAWDLGTFTAASATFATVTHQRTIVDGEPVGEPVDVEPDATSRFLRSWARQMGANAVGITALRDYHVYTHVGRGEDYGKPVELPHEWAIAFTVEMDLGNVGQAPMGPTVMESAQQYLSSAAIAVTMADFLRRLGWSARAHIDGNYRVICPLVARDAGLGEIGRMGLLMTPELGPRVRIGVVSTDMPLVPDARRPDPSVVDFCNRCVKCVEICPVRAIPCGDRHQVDGVKRWQIDSEACFTYWCRVGTDCARCMAVCPWSHGDNVLHRVVRSGVRSSSRFRRFAVRADDFFYGRWPAPKRVEEWMRLASDRPEGAFRRERAVP